MKSECNHTDKSCSRRRPFLFRRLVRALEDAAACHAHRLETALNEAEVCHECRWQLVASILDEFIEATPDEIREELRARKEAVS